MLAYHWSSALELVRASGGGDDELVERTRRALRAAGDRAFALNSYVVAAAQYEDALALWPDDAERPEAPVPASRRAAPLLRRGAPAGSARGRARRIAGSRRHRARIRGGVIPRARLLGSRSSTIPSGSISRARRISPATRSRSRRRGFSPSPDVSERSRARRTKGDVLAEAAFAMATELGLDELRAHALTTIGMAKNDVDLGSGIADMERALEIALAADSPVAASIVNNLAVYATFAGDFRRTDELYAEAHATRRALRRRRERPLRPRQPHLDRLHARALGPRARVSGYVHRRVRGGIAAHARVRSRAKCGPRSGSPAGIGTARFATSCESLELAQTRHEPFHGSARSQLTAATLRRARAARRSARTRCAGSADGARDRAARRADAALGPFADELGIGDELRDAVAAGAGPTFP